MKTIYDYEKRIVAFVDILGFQSMVDTSVVDHYTFLKIRDALERFRELKREKEDDLYDKDIKVTTFSDSLVISYPANYVGGLFHILLDLTILQFDLLQNGVFVRGGIALGDLRHIQKEIFGPAMNAAYHLENEKAIYPRIIIEESTLNTGIDSTYDKQNDEPLIDQNNHDVETKEVTELLKKDPDGYYSLDYLRIAAGELDTIDEYYLALNRARNYIQTALSINHDNDTVRQKYEWLANYYNTVVTELEAVNGSTGLSILEVGPWVNQ